MSRLAVCLLGLALLPACAFRNDYLLNRGGDLADVLRLHVMAGTGVAVHVEATRALSLGVTYEDEVWAAGLGNRELGTWRETVQGWGLLVGHHDEVSAEPLGPISGSYGWNLGSGGGSVFELAPGVSGLDLLTFRGTAMVLIGLDVEVRVGELIDFFGGIVGFDPSADDMSYERMAAAEAEAAQSASRRPDPPRNPALEP